MTVIEVKLPKSSTRDLKGGGATVVEVVLVVLNVVAVEAVGQVTMVDVDEIV
jgi:hypothetical protein